VERDEAIEQIDIGGPSMVRSAAKNHRFVGIVTDPADYGRVLDELQRTRARSATALRRELAVKAFATTARYDAAISAWLLGAGPADGRTSRRSPRRSRSQGSKAFDLRYGENPHQRPPSTARRSPSPRWSQRGHAEV
jgi:phosphoribosylaminoimidazolecarboxamide formyltransferase/IMP cyclohydrolase